jgi:hypothetical protein
MTVFPRGIVAVVAWTFLSFLLSAIRAARGHPRDLPRVVLVGLASASLIAGSLGLFLGAALGVIQQRWDAANYYGWYGTLTVVHLPAQCTYVEVTRHGLPVGEAPEIDCHPATWQLDGRTQTGTAHIDFRDLASSGANLPQTVEAFVLKDGDAAYTRARAEPVQGDAWLASLPWWLIPLTPATFVLGVVLVPLAVTSRG